MTLSNTNIYVVFRSSFVCVRSCLCSGLCLAGFLGGFSCCLWKFHDASVDLTMTLRKREGLEPTKTSARRFNPQKTFQIISLVSDIQEVIIN